MSKIDVKHVEPLFTTDDIPPRAFPSNAIHPKFGGMTLLEYYAGKALPAIILAVSAGQHSIHPDCPIPESFARDAFAIADAMMAEREKRNGS